MPNYDGQFEITAIYSVTISSRTFQHRLTFDVKAGADYIAGTPAEDVEVESTSGLIVPMITAVDDLFDVLWLNMGTGTSQPTFELWKYDPEPSLDKTFITAWEPTAPYSIGATAAVAAHQTTLTWRSSGGSYLRLQLMEDIHTGENKIPMPTTTAIAAVRAHLLSNANICFARDEGYPIAAMNASFGQNEKLKRKRFRTD